MNDKTTTAPPVGSSALFGGWIAESVEKPDANLTVLIHCPEGSEPVWPGYWDGEHWREITWGEIIKDAVTHWCNMPEPPNAEISERRE